MTFVIALVVLWIIAMVLVTDLFCGAAREFVSAPDVSVSYVQAVRSLDNEG